jgi:UTP--glucose-1-phosphate uridylyltransferase
MNVLTGVIAAAGSGTRMLPITLGYPKELLPIINKPAIQLIIEEFLAAGINKVIIVTGENSDPLRRKYQPTVIPPRGRYKALDDFMDLLAKIQLVIEPQVGPYGNGTPLLVAQKHIPENEGFLYAYGDDLLKTKKPFAQQLVELHQQTGALAVGVQSVPWEDVVRYGVVELQDGTTNVMRDVIEKPPRAEAKSNLAMFGRFLLSHDVIQILREIPLGKSNELWLTDSVREYVRRGGRVVVNPVTDGEWLTIGDPVNYLQTLIEYALEDAELRAALEPRIRRLMKM